MKRRSFLGGALALAAAPVLPALPVPAGPTFGFIRFDNNAPLAFRNNGLGLMNIELAEEAICKLRKMMDRHTHVTGPGPTSPNAIVLPSNMDLIVIGDAV